MSFVVMGGTMSVDQRQDEAVEVQLFSTLDARKRPLSRRPDGLRMFVCGPTVYDRCHLGHGKTYVQFDALVRHLRRRGYAVSYVQNITDVDAKIARHARAIEMDEVELARESETNYFQDMKTLRVFGVSHYVRVSSVVERALDQVRRLVSLGYAYVLDGSVYFDTSKSRSHGGLAHCAGQSTIASQTAADAHPSKRNLEDFALWGPSGAKERAWPSEFGRGRPGWHIQDTAVTESALSFPYDVHGGAADLLYPHHDAQFALIEALTGRGQGEDEPGRGELREPEESLFHDERK